MAGATNERSCVMSTYSMLVRWSPGRVGMVGFRRPRIATGTLTSLIVTKRPSQSLSFFPATHVYLVVAYVVCHLIQKLISDSEHNHSVDFLLAIPQPCDILAGNYKTAKVESFPLPVHRRTSIMATIPGKPRRVEPLYYKYMLTLKQSS